MDHREDVAALDELYTEALLTHGDEPAAVQWSSRASQERRMAVLAGIVPIEELREASILDFGCGTGHLLTYLRRELEFTGSYIGYDISTAMVDATRARCADDPGARAEQRDVLVDGVGEDVDLIIVNGTFNNRVSDSWALMADLLRTLFPHCRTGLAFNCMSSYVDYTDPGLAYQRPEDVFTFCKTELSPLVTLRHDYQVKDGVTPFEFSTYVYRSDLGPVPGRQPT